MHPCGPSVRVGGLTNPSRYPTGAVCYRPLSEVTGHAREREDGQERHHLGPERQRNRGLDLVGRAACLDRRLWSVPFNTSCERRATRRGVLACVLHVRRTQALLWPHSCSVALVHDLPVFCTHDAHPRGPPVRADKLTKSRR